MPENQLQTTIPQANTKSAISRSVNNTKLQIEGGKIRFSVLIPLTL
jgi:hypothetical protein